MALPGSHRSCLRSRSAALLRRGSRWWLLRPSHQALPYLALSWRPAYGKGISCRDERPKLTHALASCANAIAERLIVACRERLDRMLIFGELRLVAMACPHRYAPRPDAVSSRLGSWNVSWTGWRVHRVHPVHSVHSAGLRCRTAGQGGRTI